MTFSPAIGKSGAHLYTSTPQRNGHITTAILVPGDYSQVYSNGIALPWDPSLGRALAGPLTAQRCAVGSVVGTWSQQGDVGEVQIYSGVLSAAQREMLECRLGAKWGIGVEGCKEGRPVTSY
ncbi:MAG TPA: hypothetical protein VM580_00515 [Labilithrix sp.]|jgi:hypothetical protein|nr:hypothetical protein [Labilithrix sp.]